MAHPCPTGSGEVENSIEGADTKGKGYKGPGKFAGKGPGPVKGGKGANPSWKEKAAAAAAEPRSPNGPFFPVFGS